MNSIKLSKKNMFNKLFYVKSKKEFFFETAKGIGRLEANFINFFNKDNNKLEGFFSKSHYINSLSKSFANIQNGLTKGFYAELLLRGVGFKCYFLNSNKILFNLGYSHFILYEVPLEIIIYIKKGKLFLYSLNKEKLGDVVRMFKNFRVPDVYKAKGIVEVGQFFALKEGKKR
jgi:ribosomal protein L6P/L9E